MGSGTYKPEWTPKDAGREFASQVMPGVSGEAAGAPPPAAPTAKLTVEDYVNGVLAGNRMILSRAITLVESNATRHFETAQQIIQRILPYTGKSVRVGITGVPGAGKSTFIECLGTMLCRRGRRVAVLAVDPSSTVSRGSILGDKTRMENLSREENAFIRPSPSGGTLGGVARKSRETLLLCEAAGYDTVLVETVGVGQGETTVRSMVDFFLVIAITGAGDELQGMKKGVIELADAIVVNKADGDNMQKALATRASYNQILHYLRPATEGWTTRAYVCSSLTGDGVGDIWQVVMDFMDTMNVSGRLVSRRQRQTWEWVQQIAQEHIRHRIAQSPVIADCAAELERRLLAGETTATMAAKQLIEAMDQALRG